LQNTPHITPQNPGQWQLGAADHMGHIPKVEVPQTIRGHSKIVLLVDDNPVDVTGVTTRVTTRVTTGVTNGFWR